MFIPYVFYVFYKFRIRNKLWFTLLICQDCLTRLSLTLSKDFLSSFYSHSIYFFFISLYFGIRTNPRIKFGPGENRQKKRNGSKRLFSHRASGTHSSLMLLFLLLLFLQAPPSIQTSVPIPRRRSIPICMTTNSMAKTMAKSISIPRNSQRRPRPQWLTNWRRRRRPIWRRVPQPQLQLSLRPEMASNNMASMHPSHPIHPCRAHQTQPKLCAIPAKSNGFFIQQIFALKKRTNHITKSKKLKRI